MGGVERNLRDHLEQPLPFTKEDVGIQRGKATGPRSQNKMVPDAGLLLSISSPGELFPLHSAAFQVNAGTSPRLS